jgi:hypothetical protein
VLWIRIRWILDLGLLIQDTYYLSRIQRNLIFYNTVFIIYYGTYLITHFFLNGYRNFQLGDADPAESVINWPPGSGSEIQDKRSANPVTKEILTDPQHWF